MARGSAVQHARRGRNARAAADQIEDNEPLDDGEEGEAQPGATPSPSPSGTPPQDLISQRDREVMRGGPGDSAGFQFSYGGRTFETQEDLTEFIESLRTPPARTPSPSPSPAPAAAPAATPQPTPQEQQDWFSQVKWEEELFRDPDGAMKRLREGIKGEVTQELTRSYTQQQALERYWTDFEKEHKDMVGKHDIVQRLVLPQIFNEVADLPGKESRKVIAEKTREYIANLTGTQTPPNREDRPGSRTTVEGGSGPRQRSGRQSTGGQDQPAQPTSLSAIIRARAAARRGANGAA